MNERCKHIRKDGFRCGSYAFNLYKDDIDQGDLCDVHYWQAKAQRTWVGLTDDEVNAATPVIEEQILIRVMEAKLKEKNNG
jgi:hypothetical protein